MISSATPRPWNHQISTTVGSKAEMKAQPFVLKTSWCKNMIRNSGSRLDSVSVQEILWKEKTRRPIWPSLHSQSHCGNISQTPGSFFGLFTKGDALRRGKYKLSLTSLYVRDHYFWFPMLFVTNKFDLSYRPPPTPDSSGPSLIYDINKNCSGPGNGNICSL